MVVANEPGFEDGGFEIRNVALGTDAAVNGGDERGGIVYAEEDRAHERAAEKRWDAIGFTGCLAEELIG